MNRKLIYNVGVGALSVLMAVSQITPAFAGSWQNSQNGWSYLGDDGKPATGWVQTESGWYYIDPKEGIMKTGWQQSEDGTWFFLSNANNASQGSMLTGWCWIDGYCYYFNPEIGPNFGKMAANITTPDGYQLNADGKWVNDGQVVYEAGKGFTTIPQNVQKTTTRKSGNSSGGGSGSRSSSGRGNLGTVTKEENAQTSNTVGENKEVSEVEEVVTPSKDYNSQDNESKSNENSDSNGKTKEEEAVVEDADKFAYVNYTKNVKIDFGEYVVVTFKYGTIDEYNVLVDGTDVTDNMTKVDDDGHVVKWLSSVSNPSALKIVRKSDGEVQEITLSGGNAKNIVKTDLQAPKYVISNGPITKFDYYLETYDEEGRVRKDASKTTFTLQKKKVDSKTLSVPTQYYIPITEINEAGQGNIKIKLSLENEEQEKWFEGLNNIKLLDDESNIINSNLVYTTAIETQFGKTGVINIPLPQDNARSRGDYYVSVGSANGNSRIRLPISLVTNTNFKVLRDSTTPNPKVGDDIRFKIKDPEGKQSFGNDIKLVMYKVTLTKPDGSVVTLPKYDSWYNIGELLHISGKNKRTEELFTDVPGVYTATIYATGYKTMIKKFEVLSSDGTSVENTAINDDSKSIDSISSPTVSKSHSGNREKSNEVLNGYSSGSTTSKAKSDATSSASKKSGGSGADATSGASGSLMINAYLMYDYDLLANAMVLNEIGLRNAESSAVMKWWLEQTPEAIVGEDKEKLYILNNFVDAYNGARLDGNVLSFEDYIASSDAKTRNIVGNVKNVLENGKLGTVYRYGDIVGESAPSFSGLTQPKGDSYTITTENTDFIEKLESVVLDDLSSPLRSDSYLKQYEISADKKSITIYKSAFNEYVKPIVGTHKITLDATGYAKVDLQLIITDSLENVELQNESEKLETDSPIVIKAINDADGKNGDFIKALNRVQIQNPEGELKDVFSRLEGGLYSDSVYEIKDGRINFGKGLFKTAGEYTIFLKAQGYPVKSIKFTLAEKAEEPVTPPVVNENAKTPEVSAVKKTESFFYNTYTFKFQGMEDAEVEKYLEKATEVSVNGVNYPKTGGMGFGFGNSSEFSVHSDSVYGGKKVQLSIKGDFTAEKYEVTVKAAGYEDLSFEFDKSGNLNGNQAKNEETPVVPVAKIEIDNVEAAKVNFAEAYIITLKGDDEKISEFIEKLSEVRVNGAKVNKGYRISSLSGDVYVINGNDIQVKSDKFKGFGDEIILKADGLDDVSFKTSSKMPTPAFKNSEVKTIYGNKFVRATFDASKSVVLKNFMNEIKKGNITVTVNGETFNRTAASRLTVAKTFKVSQNGAYGRDEYIDFSMEGFDEGSNEVVISSENFESIVFNVEVPASTASATSGASGFRSMAMVQRDLAVRNMSTRSALENKANLATSSNAGK